MRTVSLMFSANCRTVVRLMEAWYDAQVSLRALAGRQFVYPSTRWGGGGGGGGWGTPPPPRPPRAHPVWVHSCSARYNQQPRSLHWLWPCCASKRPSLFLAHVPLSHIVITREGPASHHQQLLYIAMHHLTSQTWALYEAGAVAHVPCLLPCALQGCGAPAKKGKRATGQPGKPENQAMPRASTTTC
jgi:hypothetical protein